MEVDLLTDSGETSLQIPEDLVKKLKKRAEERDFKSLSEYVTYILRQVLSHIEAEEKQKEQPPDQKGEEEVKQKLRDLGYID